MADTIPLCIRRAIHDGAYLIDIAREYDTDALWEYYRKYTKSPNYIAHLLGKEMPIPDSAFKYIDFTIQSRKNIDEFRHSSGANDLNFAQMQMLFDAGYANLMIFKETSKFAALDLQKSLMHASYIIFDNIEQYSNMLRAIIDQKSEYIYAILHNENISDVDLFLLLKTINMLAAAADYEIVLERRPLLKLLVSLGNSAPTLQQIGEILRMAAATNHTLYDTMNASAQNNNWRRCFLSKADEIELARYNTSCCCVSNYCLLFGKCSFGKLFGTIFTRYVQADVYEDILEYVVHNYPQYFTHFIDGFVHTLVITMYSSNNTNCVPLNRQRGLPYVYVKIYEKYVDQNLTMLDKTIVNYNGGYTSAQIQNLITYYKRSPMIIHHIHNDISRDNIKTIIELLYGDTTIDKYWQFAAEFPTVDLLICIPNYDPNYHNNGKFAMLTIFGRLKQNIDDKTLEIIAPDYTYTTSQGSMRDLFDIFAHIILHSPRKLDQIWNESILGPIFIRWFDARLRLRAKLIEHGLRIIPDVDVREKICTDAILH
jgi:hypothetical protein